jgi:NADH-quinone oxidoreductase subunit C
MDFAALHACLSERLGAKLIGIQTEAANPWILVAPEAIVEAATFARDDARLAFDNLMNLSAVDYPKETPPRLEVVYHLFSYAKRHTVVLKVHLPRDQPVVPSVEGVWPAANWHEREAFDLFGITFTGHSDLRRILLPDDWQGHPLRKDWVDPELYNGMRVKPPTQMMERAQAGETIGVGPFDETPPNRHAESL